MIGVGNQFRHDDGAGPAVIERLRGQLPGEIGLVVTDGDAVRLIEAWSGASLAVVVDAVRADPPVPGRLHRFIVGPDPHGAGGTGPGHGGWTGTEHGRTGPGHGKTEPGAGRTGPGPLCATAVGGAAVGGAIQRAGSPGGTPGRRHDCGAGPASPAGP